MADLFMRRGEDMLCPKSTVMFAYFAQWFTDGFLRSDRRPERDPRRNDSTHEIDLLPLYGVRPAWTEQLREHEGGRLKSQQLGGAEFPPFLCEGGKIKPEFSEVSVVRPRADPAERWDTLFAAGSDTTNSQLGFVMLNTLFLREHNRVAGLLAREYPAWDDERLFQTARNILIVLLIKIVIEEYINHITPYFFQLAADPTPFKNERWNRPNWMAIEFNLLYRWHGLIPTKLRVGGRRRADLEDDLQPGAGRRARARRRCSRRRRSSAPAGSGVLNVAPALRDVELASDPRGPRRAARALQRLPRAARSSRG